MRLLLLFFSLLKGTITSFAGLASLPVIREELVVNHGFLSDHELNAAVVLTRSTPGPVGVYVVSVGYFAAGVPGAIAGWLAMALPSLAVVALLRFFQSRAHHPRVRGMLEAVVVASAALLVNATIPLAADALRGWVTVAIAVGGTAVLLWRRIDSLWVIVAGALLTLGANAISPLPP